jgi:hypothetical protein
MSVSMSSIGTTLARLGAENAIESGNANRAIRRAGYEQADLEKRQQVTMKEIQADIQQVKAVVEVAQEVVNTAQAGAKFGQEVGDANKYGDTTRVARSAQGQTGATRESTIDQLRNMRINDTQTVGERFSGEQLGVLMNPDRIQSQAQLEGMGFSHDEARELMFRKEHGMASPDQMVNFMWQHRQSPEQASRQANTDKMIEAMQKLAGQQFTQGFNMMSKNVGAQSKRAGERASEHESVASRAHDAEVDHNAALGDIELQAIRQKRGASQQSSSSVESTQR